MVVNILFFIFGLISAVGIIFIWVSFYSMQEKLRLAEAKKKLLEEEQRKMQEEQAQVQQQLQQMISELMKRRQSQLQYPPSTDPNLSGSVKERLKKAVELTAKQMKIDPRNNPVLMTQNNELELEKLAVLKTILADGFDPVITIRYNTGDEEVLLSTYVASIQKGLV